VTAPPGSPAPDPSKWTLPRVRIGADGEWYHEDEEVTHPGVLADLRARLRVDAGGHYLEAGPVRVPVEVETAPYAIVRVEAEGDRLVLTLNDLTREPLAAETLRFGADGAPYCRVKAGRFEARATRAAAFQLLRHAEADPSTGRTVLAVGGARYALPAPPPDPDYARPAGPA
jgi:hypothetical protein